MKPPVDCATDRAPTERVAAARDLLAARGLAAGDGPWVALAPAPAADTLTILGRELLVRLGVPPTDVIPPGRPAAGVYLAVGQAFLDYVVPTDEELTGMPAAAVAEYLEALATDPPDAGRLAAAFGAARPGAFGRDRRLMYRVGGYLGRSGDPLADHLIEAVVRPAAATA